MMESRVLIMGDPALYQSSQSITSFDGSELTDLVKTLIHVKEHKGGVGIAAPQIGAFLRVIVLGFDYSPRYPNEKPIPLTVLINPTYTVVDETLVSAWEGCLSVPKMRGYVPRYQTIAYEAQDSHGEKISGIASGFKARALQHEIDHLDGVLFPMRIQDMTQFGYEEVLWPSLYGSEYPMPKLFS